MARQGAALQNYNNELVKSLEELCQRRHTLQSAIDTEQSEREDLERQKQAIQDRLQLVNSSLNEKLTTKAEYDRVIGEAESAYMKILESSQVLLNVVKSKSQDLRTSSGSKPVKVSSTTPDSGYQHTTTRMDSKHH